jgi:hypothetical protein
MLEALIAFFGGPTLIFLALWGYHVLRGISSGETTSGWGPFWGYGNPRKRVHWDAKSGACSRFDHESGRYVTFEPAHGERCKIDDSFLYWDAKHRMFWHRPPLCIASASTPRSVEPSPEWDPQFDSDGVPRQRIHWNGEQWIVGDVRLRRWVSQVDRRLELNQASRSNTDRNGDPSLKAGLDVRALDARDEPRQRIRWDGSQWIIWDRQLRRWVPQVDR